MNEERRAGILRASLLADLACEQQALRLKKRNHGLTEACFKLLLPRLNAFCQIDLPPKPLESAGRHHVLGLLIDLNAYMTSKSSWYQKIFPGYRSSRVTKVSNLLIDGFMSRIFSSVSSAKKHVKAASSKTLNRWKNDLSRSKSSGNPNQPVTLKGRAFAALLGSVSCGEHKWSDNTDPASIEGSVCTEFGMLLTPESAPPSSSSNGRKLGSITYNKDVKAVTESSIKRKKTIKLMSALNEKLVSDFTLTSNAGFELSDEVNGETLSPDQLYDGLDKTSDYEG
jgi:hypothetical protein